MIPPDPADIVHATGIGNISIVPANLRLAAHNLNTPDPEAIHCVAQFLAEVESSYDICLIDTPPSMQQCTLAAMVGSHWVICPVQAEQPAVQGLSHVLRTVEEVKDGFNQPLRVLGILVTMYDGRIALHRAMHQILIKQYDSLMFEQKIPIASAYKEAVIKMMPVTLGAAKSVAATAVRKLVAEIDARIISDG